MAAIALAPLLTSSSPLLSFSAAPTPASLETFVGLDSAIEGMAALRATVDSRDITKLEAVEEAPSFAFSFLGVPSILDRV